MLATSAARTGMSIGSMPGVMVVPDTAPPGEGPRAGRLSRRPAASRLLVHRPIGTAVCYAPSRLHGSRSLSASLEKGHHLCQLKKTRAIQKRLRADAQNGNGRRIGLIGPVPRHGKGAVRSPLKNQRFSSSDPPGLKDRKSLPLERMERMRDFSRSRKGAAVKCSYR